MPKVLRAAIAWGMNGTPGTVAGGSQSATIRITQGSADRVRSSAKPSRAMWAYDDAQLRKEREIASANSGEFMHFA